MSERKPRWDIVKHHKRTTERIRKQTLERAFDLYHQQWVEYKAIKGLVHMILFSLWQPDEIFLVLKPWMLSLSDYGWKRGEYDLIVGLDYLPRDKSPIRILDEEEATMLALSALGE